MGRWWHDFNEQQQESMLLYRLRHTIRYKALRNHMRLLKDDSQVYISMPPKQCIISLWECRHVRVVFFTFTNSVIFFIIPVPSEFWVSLWPSVPNQVILISFTLLISNCKCNLRRHAHFKYSYVLHTSNWNYRYTCVMCVLYVTYVWSSGWDRKK